MTEVKVNYPKEFKEEAVKLAVQSTEPKSVIAIIEHKLGIKRNILYSWISKAIQEKVESSKINRMNSSKYQALEQKNLALTRKFSVLNLIINSCVFRKTQKY